MREKELFKLISKTGVPRYDKRRHKKTSSILQVDKYLDQILKDYVYNLFRNFYVEFTSFFLSNQFYEMLIDEINRFFFQ